MSTIAKPLGIKAYGSIPHLPSSRLGSSDHHCHEGQARICTEKARDRHDFITVTEKVDGSCVAVAKLEGQIVPLIRAGYPAVSSKYEQHRLFHNWVFCNLVRFDALLKEGERAVGEWLAQAHGTRYELPHEPFVLFDIMAGHKRRSIMGVYARAYRQGFVRPRLISDSGRPFPIESARNLLPVSGHGALDPVEGAVWRVERHGKFDFMAKWLRPDKMDGIYLPEISKQPEVWNWRP